MTRYPPGFRTVWGAIATAALALLLYQAQHHAAPQQPHAGGSPRPVTSTAGPSTATAAAAAPTGSGGRMGLPAAAGRPLVPILAPAGAAGPTGGSLSAPTAPSSPAPTAAGTPPAPSAMPTAPSSPAPAPVLAASVAVGLPVRGLPSVEVRLGLVVGAAPPFPLLPGIEASIRLP